MSSAVGEQLLGDVRSALVPLRDPVKAAKQQAYMKSSLPFYGVTMPELRTVTKPLVKPLTFTRFDEFAAAVRAVWNGATHREEKYAALTLLHAKRFDVPDALPLLEELIHTGAWWDLVDDIATHRLHPLLAKHREPTVEALRRWSRSSDLWLRRSAIIAQVLAREDTDVPLLMEVIEPAIDEKEFFLRKAIGWALRSLGKHDPKSVREWLDEHGDRASGLTQREAAKGLK